MADAQTRSEPGKSRRVAYSAAVARDSHAVRLAWSLFIALFLTLFTVSSARAEAEAGIARGADVRLAPVVMTGTCDQGVVVFTVQNKVAPWATRGWLRVSDAVTGRVLRQRHMTLGDNQTASFRILSGEAQMHRYHVAVVLPGRTVTRVKRFAGRCEKGVASVQTAGR